MTKYIFSFLLIICTAFSGFAQSNEVKIKADTSKSEVTYYMTHPLHDWDAVDKQVNSIILFNKSESEIKKVAVSLAIAGFSSNSESRDAQAFRELNGKDYPLINFLSSGIAKTKDSLSVSGILTFHNVKKQISFKIKKVIQSNEIVVTGGFDVDMTDYGITPPSLMGMAVGKIIKIKFKVYYPLP